MEWVAVVLGALLLGAIGAGVYLWAELQERGRELAEARVLRKLAVADAMRAAAIQAADVDAWRIAQLDSQIDALKREAVDVREDTEHMTAEEVARRLNALLTKSLVYVLVGFAMSAGSAHAQNVVPLDHEGERGVWMPEADAVELLRRASLTTNYARQIHLFEERLRLSDEVIGNLRTALDHGRNAIDAAQALAFESEQRAINAENRASSPWTRVLWGLAGGVIGAAIAVVLSVFLL